MEHTNGIENELIEGRNAITEALRAGRPIDKIYLAGGDGDRTLGYQYDPEQLDLAENMVSQNDGSFISKKEWYV